jgi:hypothetical protein
MQEDLVHVLSTAAIKLYSNKHIFNIKTKNVYYK